MAVGVYLTTTGTLSPVVIPDMGALTFVHPTTLHNMLDDVSEDEIQSSTDLQALVTVGHITLEDDAGVPITDVRATGPHHHPIGDVDGLTAALAAPPNSHGAADHTGAIGAHSQITAVGIDDHHAQAHAASHADGGADAVKLDDLATPDDNTDLDSNLTEHGLLPKLGGGTTNFLRADGSWSAPAGGGTVDTSGTPVATDFARFTDADTIEGRDPSQVRTDLNVADGADVTGANAPQAHAASHADGGADEISVAGLSGELADAQPPKSHGAAEHTGAIGAHSQITAVGIDDHHAQAHAASHADGGADEISVAGLSGELADAQPPKSHGAADHTGAIGAHSQITAVGIDDHHAQAHAASHADGGADEISVEALATVGTIGQVPISDGAGGLSMGILTAGPLVKLFQGIDTTGGMTVTNVAQTVALDFESIKDNYYTHSTSINPGEVTILNTGWYKISAMLTVHTVSSSAGARGNPQLHIEVDTGSGFVQQPDKMGGYIREDGSENLSTAITGIGFFQFSAGDKIRITTYDTVATEPDEETVPYSSRLLIEYIDRTGAASGVVNNLKDVGDVSAAAPGPAAKLFFNSNTSNWEQEPLPTLHYGDVICADWSPSWADLYAHGPMLMANTSVALDGFVGNATVATINGLTPTANDSYLVTDAGTLTAGSVVVTAGTLVVYNGSIWVLVYGDSGGFALKGIRIQLSSTTALITPYTDGTDDGKIAYFTGASNTGVFTTLNITVTLPNAAGMPASTGALYRLYVCNFGGSGGHTHIDIASSEKFMDQLTSVDLRENGKAVMLGAVHGSLAAAWSRISNLRDSLQVRRAATWAATNFTAPTAVPFDTEDRRGNTDIQSWVVGTATRITFGFAATYRFSGFASVDSTGGSTWNCEAWLRKNGTTEIPGTRIRDGNYGGEDGSLVLPGIDVEVADGDYVEWVFDHTALTGNLVAATLAVNCNY